VKWGKKARNEELEPEMMTALSDLRARCSDCPEPAMLQAAQEGVLPADLLDAVREHVEHCAICGALRDSLSVLDEEPLPPTDRRRIWERVREEAGERRIRLLGWPAVLAAAAALLMLAGIGMLRDRSRPVKVANHGRPTGAAPAPTGLLLEKPPVRLPATAFLVWRGDAGSNPWQALRQALVPYESGDFAEAAQRLRAVADKNPRVAEARFYLGISRLFLGEDSEAAADLETARTLASGALADDAAWYLVIAYQHAGRAVEARTLLEGLCRDAGTNGAKACLALKELR
jgi:tetratricopeptide (TPR) repeat protein